MKNITICLLIVLTLFIQNCKTGIEKDVKDKVFEAIINSNITCNKQGKTISLTIRNIHKSDKIEIKFDSQRNQSISKNSDISPSCPLESKPSYNVNSEIWFPVVDIELEDGMEGIALFSNVENSFCVLNGALYKEEFPIKEITVIPTEKLEYWENTFYIKPSSAKLIDFYIIDKLVASSNSISKDYQLLSEDWSGSISIYKVDGNDKTLLKREDILTKLKRYNPDPPGANYEADLLKSLNASLDFIFNSVNNKQDSPTADGLFFLYDFDSKTFRTTHWVWTWGISMNLLIEASKIKKGLKYTPEQLIALAEKIGNRSLDFQINDKNSPADGIVVVREGLVKSENYYRSSASPADALFLAGWGWMPLYEITGDKKYLDASKKLALATEKVVEEFVIPPQDYYTGEKRWAGHGINESGFGTQGLSELYRVTKDEYYLDLTKKYMKQHLDIYQEENGLWNRLYMFETKKVIPVDFWARGMGWGMMGLMACDNIMPNDVYISWAKKMGDQLIKYQNEDGSWNHKMNSSSEEFGKCEKSTSLWGMLFYQLYAVTKDKDHLNAARKALNWCMENQYMADNDPEGYGSLPGRTFNSGIDYREWFNLSCSYSTAFFGLACVQELRIQNRDD